MRAFYREQRDWTAFYPATAFVKKIESLVEESWMGDEDEGGGGAIHLDIYRNASNSPVVVYCHGLSSAGRIMANFALPLFERGFTVICPDLPGFGLSPAPKGSSTIPELTQALASVVSWARRNFTGPVFLTGISLGGTLSYYAAAHGAPVSAIACLNLLDLSDSGNREISHRSYLLRGLNPLIGLVARLAPNLPIPLKHFMNPDRLCTQSSIVANFITNPLVVKTYTLRAIHSLLSTPPDIPFEDFRACPVLVLHGEKDELIPERLTKANYNRLRVIKRYVCLPGGEHIPIQNKAHKKYIEELCGWFFAYGQ